MAEEAFRPKSNAVPWDMVEPWAAPLIVAIAVFAFYAIPMTSPSAGIQWDAADVQYPLQKYFSEHLRSGHLPYWTPYLFSGYPLLANPEMGAWYPLNWPFFLMWMSFHAVQFELAVHAVIACVGAYLLFRLTVCRTSGAILGAFAYGLSGFFAGHSSHLTVFAAAAWFPWLLWCYRRAVDSESSASVAMGGLAGGAMILAGHLPTATFGMIGLVWYALADIHRDPKSWRRSAGIAGGIVALSLAISGMQLLPAMELIHHSRFGVDYSQQTLQPRSLMTLVLPDAIGTISMKDRGLITNHYFYGGLFLLPLAVIGARNRRIARAAMLLIVPALWYMLGPSANLYRLGGLVPALQSMGPPTIAWFLPALGLAWLAASGCHRLFQHRPYVGILCVVVFFADLWYWNLYRNPLAYAHAFTERLYSEDAGRSLAAPELPLTRFDSAGPVAGAGPRLFPLDLKFETTTGYLVLEPAIYHEYLAAMARNPRLRDGLNVGRYLDSSTGRIEINSTVLARAYFPHSVIGVASEAESRQALTRLNPVEQSTVLSPNYVLRQDPQADPFIIGSDEKSYGIHYSARVPSLLKLSVPWYPGWTARLAGRKLPILRVDHALMGVVVPSGEGVVEFSFRSTYLGFGSLIVAAALIAMVVLALGKPLWARITMRSV
jgi:hypothetical protein